MRTDWWNVDPRARERETVSLLEELPGELGAVLIGSYAVAAYTAARFSSDIDLVIPARARAATRAWFEGRDFRVVMTMVPSPATDHLGKFRVSSAPVRADIYVDGVRDRQSGASVEYEWLSRSPRRARIVLTTGRTQSRVTIARPEALWVLKLLAAREQDLTDLFAMMSERVDLREVRTKWSSIPAPLREAAERRALTFIDSEDEYRDALSRRALGRPSSPPNRATWTHFGSAVRSVLSSSRKG